MLAVTTSSSQRRPLPKWKLGVVTAAFDQTVTSLADAARLLRMEPQVRLTTLCVYRTIIRTSSFRTDTNPQAHRLGSRKEAVEVIKGVEQR